MYTLPQEIEVWYIIPSLRREIAKCLVTEYGATYEKVGNILGISKAAVSQYMKGKRASKVQLPQVVNAKVVASCKILSQEKGSATEEITKILDFIREKNIEIDYEAKSKK